MKLSFLRTHALAVHSNVFPYFTDLPVNSSFSVFIVAQPGYIIQYDKGKLPVNHLGAII